MRSADDALLLGRESRRRASAGASILCPLNSGPDEVATDRPAFSFCRARSKVAMPASTHLGRNPRFFNSGSLAPAGVEREAESRSFLAIASL